MTKKRFPSPYATCPACGAWGYLPLHVCPPLHQVTSLDEYEQGVPPGDWEPIRAHTASQAAEKFMDKRADYSDSQPSGVIVVVLTADGEKRFCVTSEVEVYHIAEDLGLPHNPGCEPRSEGSPEGSPRGNARSEEPQERQKTVSKPGESKHQHAEAFHLMIYRCEECRHQEEVWNSRDGVTPFGKACPRCSGLMTHVAWELDRYAPDYIPLRGQLVFITLPLELRPVLARARVRAFDGSRFEVQGEERQKAITDLAASWAKGEPFAIRWGS